MKRIKRVVFVSAALFVILIGVVSTAAAQSTLFTYQGRLTDNGSAANGNYDFQFKLFDTGATGTGTQQGATLSKTNVQVTSGGFSVQLDFGACPSCFNGADRFLEIAVKPAGGPTFTTLSPRQQITTAPYALKSASADGLSVACVNCVTSSQIQSVQGSQITGTIPAASVPAGSGNYIQNTTSQQASSNFNISGNGILAGSLGVGTLSPLGKLQVVTANDTNPGIVFGWDSRHFVVGNSASNGGIGMSYDQTNNVGFIEALTPGVAWRNLIFQLGGGKIGIGVDPAPFAAKLQVQGTAGAGRFKATDPFGSGVFAEASGDLGAAVFAQGSGPNAVGVSASSGSGTAVAATSTSGVGVFGLSTNNNGVNGRSTTGVGVFGESAQFDGVQGLAHNVDHGAIVGIHDGNGVAVFGIGAVGVRGESNDALGLGGFFRNTGGGKALKVEGTGSIGIIEITGGSDLAEHFEVAEEARPGMVVAIDRSKTGRLTLARGAYNRRVAGVVSGANNLTAGMVLPDVKRSQQAKPIALSGRVWVYCDATKRAIHPGDLLTTSNTAGHAMKVTDHTRARGAVIGKAMTGLKSGRGLVLALVSLQ